MCGGDAAFLSTYVGHLLILGVLSSVVYCQAQARIQLPAAASKIPLQFAAKGVVQVVHCHLGNSTIEIVLLFRPL